MSKWSIKIPLRFEKPKVLFFSVERDGKEVYSKSISNCEDLTQKDRYLYADLNELWHDVSEEPKENSDILFISKSGNVHKASKVDNQLYSWLKDNKDIKRWIYIEDLLPKE